MFGIDPKLGYILSLGAFILCVVAGFATVYFLQRDVEEDDEPAATNEDLLREFERAYYSGEMDDAEFRRVKERLLGPAPASSRPDAGPPSLPSSAEATGPANEGDVAS